MGEQRRGLRGRIDGLKNLLHYVRDPLDFLDTMKAAQGDVAQLRVMGSNWVLLSHPEDIEAVFIKHNRAMVRDKYVAILKRALGEGLLTSEGELWKRQRKLLAHAFTPKRIASDAQTMIRVGERELDVWRDGQEINLHHEMSRVTMEVVAAVLFGTGVRPEEVRDVGAAMEVANEFFASSPEAVIMAPRWLPTPRNRRMNEAIDTIDEVIFRIIRDRRAAPPKDDFLGTLLAAQDEGGIGMSDQQLRDEAITLFVAGHETTALALAYTLMALSQHPYIERKVLAELEEVLGGRLPGAADIKSLPYLGQVLKESMRLYPPAWTTGRETTIDLEFRGQKIPAGSQLLIAQWVTHRDARWYPNPEAFDPDRWAPSAEGGAKELPRYAYFPFGGGGRVCIGSHFAMMEAALLLARILQRFHVELAPGQRLEFRPSVTLRPRGKGLLARVHERRRPERAVAPAQVSAVG